VISVFSVTAGDDLRPDPHPVCISRDGLIPKAFQKVNPRTLAPVSNTVMCASRWDRGGLVDSTFLWDMVSMGPWTAFMVVSIACRVAQKEASLRPRVPGGRSDRTWCRP